MSTKQNLMDLITFINEKATFAFNSKEKEHEGDEGDQKQEKSNIASKLKQDIKTPKRPFKQLTIPEPFNLSVNKPKILKEPIAISNHPKMTPLPLANYQKTSLKEIEKFPIKRY